MLSCRVSGAFCRRCVSLRHVLRTQRAPQAPTCDLPLSGGWRRTRHGIRPVLTAAPGSFTPGSPCYPALGHLPSLHLHGQTHFGTQVWHAFKAHRVPANPQLIMSPGANVLLNAPRRALCGGFGFMDLLPSPISPSLPVSRSQTPAAGSKVYYGGGC